MAITLLVVCATVAYVRSVYKITRRTYRAYIALDGKGPELLGLSGPPSDWVVLYRTGRRGVICWDGFHSQELHDRLTPKNGQPVMVEYDTFTNFGTVGYTVHSVDGIVLPEDVAVSAGVAREGSGSAGQNDCW
jgi:hypothetical protein